MGEERKMAEMNAWLDKVCEVLDVERAQLAAVTPAILDLVAEVAHGPSRPGGPMTAVVVAMAAHRAPDFEGGVNDAIARLQPLFGADDQ